MSTQSDMLADGELRADPTCPDCRGTGLYCRFTCACVTRRPVPGSVTVA